MRIRIKSRNYLLIDDHLRLDTFYPYMRFISSDNTFYSDLKKSDYHDDIRFDLIIDVI